MIIPGLVGQGFLDHARAPRNLGEMADPDGQAMAVGTCGDSIQVALRVKDEVITQVRVKPQGCVYTMVCASAVGALALGLRLDQALDLTPQDLEKTLGGLPEDHLHCARLAVNTLGEAIADCYGRHGQAGSRPAGPTWRTNLAPEAIMIKALLVTTSPGAFAPFSASLTGEGFSLARADSGRAALEAVGQDAPDLVIIDDQLRDSSALELIKRIVQTNAFVNTAVVSAMPEAQFHDAFEGLGVLEHLPPRPGLAQAQELARKLKGLSAPRP